MLAFMCPFMKGFRPRVRLRPVELVMISPVSFGVECSLGEYGGDDLPSRDERDQEKSDADRTEGELLPMLEERPA